MMRLVRWLLRLVVDAVVIAVVIVAAGVAAYFAYLPTWAEGQVRGALADAGLTDANFALAAVTYEAIELRDVRLTGDPNAWSARSIRVTFDAGGVWDRRIERVEVDGLRWSVAYADGELDPGPVARLLGDANAASEGPGWSLGAVSVTDSIVWLAYAGRRWSLPIDTGEGGDPNAAYTVRFDRGARTLHVEVPTRTLEPDDLISTLLRREAKLDVAGRAGASIDVDMTGRARAHVDLDGVDATYTADAADADEPAGYGVVGLTGRVAFDGLTPPRTAPGQQLHWRTLGLGELSFGRGVVRFTLEGRRSVLIEKLDWQGIDGGRFWAMAMRLDPQLPDVNIDLFVEQAPLGEWLPILTLGRATGSGAVSGRLPFRVRLEPTPRIALGRGYLYAVDPGQVRIEQVDAIDAMLERGGLAASGPDAYPQVVRRRLVQSLQDFAYDHLSFVMTERDGVPTLTIRAVGRGAASGQEVNLTMNFTGYQDLIDFALRLQLGLKRAGDAAWRGLIDD